ncbi:MAG: transglutaminase domain-containing protein [Kurthia sp.]|nr:transglutaminase domain-containing protein [Candidatus Kurthia equi]
MENKQLIKWGKLLFLYVLIFLMLREWLLPIMELTDTGYYGLFILFILICLITNLFNLNPWLSACIKVIYIIWFMLFIHTPENGPFINSFIESIQAIFTGDWTSIDNSVKSMLFLILLWMTVYLIHHWLTIRRSIMLFFIITVLFLALLDVFTTYNAETSIIRVMIIGLLLTGVLFVEKLMSEYGMKASVGNYSKLIVPLLLMIIASTLFAFIMPKKEASENLPAPIQEVVKWANSSMNTTGKIGYVENDDKLGGDFETDNAPVLNYEADESQYLRIESKSTYTGKGWERAAKDVYVNPFVYKDVIKTDLPRGLDDTTLIMPIKMDKKYNFLVQPYGVYQVLSSNEKDNGFYREVESGKIRAVVRKEPITLLNYNVSYRAPIYSEKELDKSRIEMIKKDTALSKDERTINLQVPKNLPKSVSRLALEITQEQESVYDKANAIVEYFRTAGFEYSRVNVGYPTDGEDYVARFLFDTQVGYCDNFSTSMAIMMRTIGVPTRWVKGFSPGDVNGTNPDTKMKNYVVTNNNAHSWVEVYIPNVGWMPFEPTIGFGGFDNQIEEEKETASSAPQNKADELEQKKKEEQQKKEKEQQDKLKKEEQKKETQKKEVEKNKDTSAPTIIWVIVGTLLLVIVAIWLFIKRHTWLMKLTIWSYNKKQVSLNTAYNKLLRYLKKHKQLIREEGETLADFAKRVDMQLNTTDMMHLTLLMEQELYDPNAKPKHWNDFKEYWENLINKTRG